MVLGTVVADGASEGTSSPETVLDWAELAFVAVEEGSVGGLELTAGELVVAGGTAGSVESEERLAALMLCCVEPYGAPMGTKSDSLWLAISSRSAATLSTWRQEKPSCKQQGQQHPLEAMHTNNICNSNNTAMQQATLQQ